MLVRAILVLALVAYTTYALPSGFQVDKIMDVTEAMALPSLPDGRLLVAKRHGQILIIDPLSTQRPIPSQTYMTISQLNAQGERVSTYTGAVTFQRRPNCHIASAVVTADFEFPCT